MSSNIYIYIIYKKCKIAYFVFGQNYLNILNRRNSVISVDTASIFLHFIFFKPRYLYTIFYITFSSLDIERGLYNI